MRQDASTGWPAGGGMAERIRAHPWADTPLGSAERWPQSLRTALDMVLAMPGPASLFVGPAGVQLYNDAYVAIARDRHPALLGRPVAEGWPDAMDVVAPLLDAARAGRATRLAGIPVPLAGADGRLEERIFDTDWSPVRDEAGRVAAVLQTLVEVTDRHRAEAALREGEARRAFLLELSDALRSGDELPAAMRLVARHFRVDRAEYLEVDGSGAWIERRAGFADGLPPSPDRAPLADADARSAERAGEILMDAGSVRFPGDRDGAHASLTAPVRRDGRLRAMLAVVVRGSRAWSPGDVSLLAEAAERVWAAAERTRGEAALASSEQRFRALAEAIADVFYVTDLERGALDYLSPSFERVWGRSATELEADLSAFERTIHPDDVELFHRGKAEQARGERVAIEYRIVRPNGEVRWIYDRSFPVGEDGLKRAAGIAADITDRKRAGTALAESEDRLRTLMEGIPQLVWRSCADGLWTWASPQWTDFTGLSQDESRGRGWLDAVHPADRDATLRAWDEARRHGRLDVEYRVRRAADGAWVWHHTRSVPVRDGEGRILEWLGTTTDVQQLKELQQRQGVLVAELQHRVRNILAVIRSVFGRTVDAGDDLETVADHFRGRLDALARTQTVVTGSADGRVDLENMIRDELLSVGAGHGPDVRIDGPEVSLPPKAAESIGLAVHELTTNAIKYGALKVKGGKLIISWLVNIGHSGDQTLDFTWVEQGVPVVSLQPPREGFGRELIEQALPYRLQAETELEFRPGGVRCRILLPLPGGGSAAQANEVT